MLRHTLLAAVVGMLSSGAALAQPTACPCVSSATRVNGGDIAALLRGNTVCAVLGTERWQEFHQVGGQLFEMGNVAGGELAGSWEVALLTRVRYNYGSGGSYDYAVCTEGSNVHFCGSPFSGRDIPNATLVPGRTNCPGAARPAASR